MSRTCSSLAAIVLDFATLFDRGLWTEALRTKLTGMKKPATFEEAFQILDQAIVDIDEPRLRPLIDGELLALKTSARTEFADRVQSQKELISLGMGHAEDVIHHVGESVRRDPLLYIGAAALAAGAIGVLLSKRAGATA